MLDSTNGSLQDWSAFTGADVYDQNGYRLESPGLDRGTATFYNTPPESPISTFSSFVRPGLESDHQTSCATPSSSTASPAFPAFGSFRDCPSPYIGSSQNKHASFPSSPALDDTFAPDSPMAGPDMRPPIRHARSSSSSHKVVSNRLSLTDVSQPYSLAKRRDRHRPSLSISVSRSSSALVDALGLLHSPDGSHPGGSIAPHDLHSPMPQQHQQYQGLVHRPVRPSHRHSYSVPATPLFRSTSSSDERTSSSPELRSSTPGIEAEILDYIASDDKQEKGERTVVILNANIAQRSYGSERRRVVPPPVALLLGKSWWSTPTSVTSYDFAKGRPPTARLLHSPIVSIDMSTSKASEEKKSVCGANWLVEDGTSMYVTERSIDDPPIISGRAMGQGCSAGAGQLDRTRAECTIEIGQRNPQLLGKFTSRPIQIVSKVPKKPSLSPGLHVLHGSTICLYHRKKNGSVRYLTVSGNQTMFPMMDWRATTGGKSRSYAANAEQAVFEANAQNWDTFVIYAVDQSRKDDGVTQADASPSPYLPRPPVRALRLNPDTPIQIHYNQLVVLQCVATAVVSPVMIVRRIEDKLTMIGGGSPGPIALPAPAWLEAAPGEILGEAITPCRTFAFEIYKERPTQLFASETDGRKSFLACFDDTVGFSHTDAAPSSFHDASSVSPYGSPMPSPALGSPPSRLARPSTLSRSSTGQLFDFQSEFDEEERAPYIRHASSTPSLLQSPLRQSSTRPRIARRGRSTSNLGSDDFDIMVEDPVFTSVKTEGGLAPSKVQNYGCWSLEVAENCAWCMVGVEIDRCTFFIPPSLRGRTVFSRSSTADKLHDLPVPSRPIISDEIPRIKTYTRAIPGDVPAGHNASEFITLRGQNLTSDMSVYLGPHRCPIVVCSSPTQAVVQDPLLRPHSTLPLNPSIPRRIVVSRSDGVTFPSSVYYFPLPTASVSL